jgi:hypothetical protein
MRPQGVVNVVLGSDPILLHSVEVQNDWIDSELRMLCALLISPRLASRGQGLSMGDVSVALRRGIRHATAPVAGTWPKISAVVDMGNI